MSAKYPSGPIARGPRRSLLTQRAWALLAGVAALVPTASFADNPIVQTNYTADPAPMVYGGRLYVYTGHDEDATVNNFFTMNEWRVYSTTDVVNWTDHGSPLRYSNFSWAKGDAWAGQCIPRNGKFYYYVPMTQKNGAMAIGVACVEQSDRSVHRRAGEAVGLHRHRRHRSDGLHRRRRPSVSLLGEPQPLVREVECRTCSLTRAARVQVSLTTAGFGTRKDTTRATSYEEGPWFYKRDGRYYLVYPANGIPEQISYSTSTGPTGPWTFRSVIMPASGASFTNHAGIVDFNGSSYFFYHNGALPGGGGYKRSVAVERFTYNADGTIPTIEMSTGGPPSNGNLNPYVTTEAETIAWESGIETEVCSEGGMNVTSINNGDYIKVKAVNFGTGAVSFDARVASASTGGSIELRLDSQTGTLVGTCAVPGTGGAQTWATKSCTVSGATGIHDLYLKFTGGSGDLFKFNWWKFTPRDPLPDADGGATDGGGTDAGAGGASGGAGGGLAGQGGLAGRGGQGGGAGGVAGGAAAVARARVARRRAAPALGAAVARRAAARVASRRVVRPPVATAALRTAGRAPVATARQRAWAAAGGVTTGAAGSVGTGTGGSPPESDGSGGCSCDVGRGRGNGLLVIALGLLLARRRRRR